MDYMGEQNSWIGWTNDDWASWIDENVEERRQVFSASPDDMVASFNREKSHARDYHGRELLELIQNADDSGIHYSGESKLLIHLTDYGLFVANTGVPFSPDGVKSLMISDNSPKQFLRTQCIGYKGLGFRSVLGWASSVIILSGKLSVGFSEDLASGWLRKLREANHKVDRKVKQFEAGGITNPISTLSIPRLLSSADDLVNEESRELYREGKRILERGYDTVICLLFRDPVKIGDQVQKQINSLGSEILLFLQFLEKINIESSGKNESLIVERREKEIIVNPRGNDSRVWKVFKREGEIPSNLLRPEQVFNNKYEIKLAIPDEPVEVNKLFVFFPTEVRFPFPLIAHATFEVGDNRQHLIDSDVNRFIAGKLADLMAESAEGVKNIDNPWYALSVISPSGDIDSVLEKFGFLEMLEKSIKEYALLPVRNKKFGKPSVAKRIKGNFDSLLIGDVFADVCLYADDYSLKKQLDRLGVSHVDYDDLRERLNKISATLPIEPRADIIFSLVQNNLIDGEPPELLIDEQGEKIPIQSSVFLPPEKKVFPLPSWVSQKILSSELTAKLRDKFSVSRVRDIASNMSSFNVQEYNMNSLVSSISAETNRRAKDNPREELVLRQQMIQAMWSLYSSTEKVKLREEITVILPARNGGFDAAQNLYFGKEYAGGKVLEYLYSHIDPALFIASPENLVFPVISPEIEDFLCWLGVNKSPRYKKANFNYGDFHDYAVSSLTYPAKFEEITIWNPKGLEDCYISLSDVSCIDKLEEVISSADPHAIICWIATSPDVDSWRLNKDTGAIFKIKQPHQQRYRQLSNQAVPSHPLWLLKNMKWLPTSGGNKLSPLKCSLAHVTKDIEPVIGYPAIDMEHLLIKELNLDRTAIKNALIKIGVVTNLDELPWDSFYEVLFELPKLDPEGSKAKSLYRILVEGSDADASPNGKKHDEFMISGKMMGRVKGILSYYPIRELFYVENITLPSNIAEQFPLLEVDKRRGASKIKKLFGVEQLTRDKIQIEIIHFEEHPASQNFQGDIERLKPYIYALRVEADTNRANLSVLKKLKVILCRSVRVAVAVSGERREIDLKEGDSVNIDSVFYLVSEPSDYSRSFLEDEIIADALGEIVSNILKVDAGDQIARLSSCSFGKRDLLLNRLVGGSGAERMLKTRELFETTKDKEEDFSEPAPWTPPPKTVKQETPTTEYPGDLLPSETAGPDEVGDIEAREIGASASQIKRTVIARRIQENPKTRGGSHSKKKVNPDRAENLAKSFEEFQGRYAEKVSHIRGLEGYGCDILSFRTQEDLDSFKTNNNPDLVERFIEVKGSANEKGPVSLGGNELNSANTHREKFFLYRIYEDEKTGLFELIELSDPLGEGREALSIHYEVNPYHSAKSHLWEIEEKDDESEQSALE